MKLITIFILGFCFQGLSNNLSAQEKINLDLKNANIEDVFKSIEAKTSYRFVYSEDLLKNDQKVSVHVKNATLDQVMDLVLRKTNFSYKAIDKTLISILSTFKEPQAQLIEGKVLDEKGHPIEGASVVEKGTNNGTITHADGSFSLDVKGHAAVLLISSIGFLPKEIALLKWQGEPVVLVASYKETDSVIVTAYGKVKAENLTDAVATIDAQKLQDRPLRSLADGLVGLAAGLNVRIPSGAPEATPAINIRGFTGINAAAAPLVLIDGIERPIQDINPNDVESISVLKDAASTAVYGSRAPYGIILITTKSGKSGKLVVNYSSNYKYATLAMRPVKPESYDWAGYINQVVMSNPSGTGTPVYSDLTIQRMKAWAAGDFDNPVFDGIDKKYVLAGQFPDPTVSYGYGNFTAFANDDFFGAYFKDVVPSNQQNISFSGGTDKATYYVGLGYNDTKGIFKGFDNYDKRYNALSKITYKAASWLDLDASMNFVRSGHQEANFRGAGTDYFSIFSNITGREYINNPIRNPDNPDYITSVISLATIQGQGGVVDATNNDLTFTGGFTLKPAKGLNVVGSYTFRNSTAQNETTQKVIYQWNPDGTTSPSARSAGNSAVYKTYSGMDYRFYKIYADYSKTVASDHHFYIQVGSQAEDETFKSLSGSGQGLYSQDVITSISTTSGNYVAGDRLYDWSTLGYYGVFTYDYRSKYMLKLAARRDASSRFSPDARWGFFPAVSAAWNVGKEDFWPLKDEVPGFKLRFSWSKSGDLTSIGSGTTNGNLYTYTPTLGTANSTQTLLGGNFISYVTPAPLVSSTLTWAKPTMLDFGADVTALKNRLTFTYDWYQRTTYDQVGPPNPVAQTLGVSPPVTNNSVSETRGWEAKISWNDNFMLARKPFQYGLSFLISDYVGYVVKYASNNTGARDGQWTAGQQFGQNYVYKANPIIQNTSDLNHVVLNQSYGYPGYLTYQDLNGDGYINGGNGTPGWYSLGDLVTDGFDYPRKSYSILPTVSWNGISLSAVLEGVMQWKQFVSTNSEYVFGTNGSQFFAPFYEQSNKLGYWNTDNKDAFFPAISQTPQLPNTGYISNLANLRIRNIVLGYDLPQSLIKRLKLQRVNIYLSGENLGFIYNKSFVKYDPELLDVNGTGYPPMRNYSFGLNVTL